MNDPYSYEHFESSGRGGRKFIQMSAAGIALVAAIMLIVVSLVIEHFTNTVHRRKSRQIEFEERQRDRRAIQQQKENEQQLLIHE